MAQLPKGGLVRSHDKPIHGSCAIYFSGGIAQLSMKWLFLYRKLSFIQVIQQRDQAEIPKGWRSPFQPLKGLLGHP